MAARRFRLFVMMLPVIILVACDRPEPPYAMLPVLERSTPLVAAGDTLQPLGLRIHRQRLYVSSHGLARVDVYDLDLNHLGSIPLVDPEPIYPGDFTVTDSLLFSCDHAKRVIVAHDLRGRFRYSFDLLPDGTTGLTPRALTCFAGVLYVADVDLGRVLAISVVDATGITEIGELILTIPGEADPPLGQPSTIFLTGDGRLLVGEMETGAIRVFTCDGRAIYNFDEVPGATPCAPRGIAEDGLTDPSLQVANTFDPSGLSRQGRIHVLDGEAGRLHMYNPVGRYVGSYPRQDLMDSPTGLAIDRVTGRIFVADPAARRIHIFRYSKEV